MPTLVADQTQLHYLDRGTGLPVVLQHGLGGDVSQILAIAPSGADVRLLCLESRGHGESDLGDVDSLSFKTSARDVALLLDSCHVRQAVIGGISMGAGVALRLATDDPSRVRGLILVRPAWLFEPLPANLAHLPDIARLIRAYGRTEGRTLFASSERYAETADRYPATAASLLDHFRLAPAVLDAFAHDVPVGNADAVSMLDMPTLVIGCDDDPVHPLAMAAELARLIPNAWFVQVPSKNTDPDAHVREIGAGIAAFVSASSHIDANVS